MTASHETGRAKAAAVLARLRDDDPLLVGIVNVTPDSFSDGGSFLSPEAALAEARRHVAAGAALVDVGAESTRPGFLPVSEEEEQARLRPVLATLIDEVGVAVSIDTTKAAVAAAALDSGAAFVNDQWGFQGDPAMARQVATAGAGAILMHNRTGIDPSLDMLDEMRRFFDRSLAVAAEAGVSRERIILDPGIGFGKSKAQNLLCLGAGVATLAAAYGLPVLVGASRKSLFASLIGAKQVEDRLVGTLAAHLASFAHGARLFRVHDCAEHRDAFGVTRAVAGHRARG